MLTILKLWAENLCPGVLCDRCGILWGLWVWLLPSIFPALCLVLLPNLKWSDTCHICESSCYAHTLDWAFFECVYYLLGSRTSWKLYDLASCRMECLCCSGLWELRCLVSCLCLNWSIVYLIYTRLGWFITIPRSSTPPEMFKHLCHNAIVLRQS